MSVKAMSAAWDYDIPKDEKFVLLAYADHADHEGKNIFPAVATIAKKTGYKSERSVQTITRKLEKMGLLIPDGKGAHGTNKWRMPLQWGAKIAPAEIAGVQNEVSALGAKERTEGAQPTAPEPSLDSDQPSIKDSGKAAPEIILFRAITGKFPSKDTFSIVIKTIGAISSRLGREVFTDDLLPFWEAWRAKGYRPTNLSWLTEWALSGCIPQKSAAPQKQSLPEFQDRLSAWMNQGAD